MFNDKVIFFLCLSIKIATLTCPCEEKTPKLIFYYGPTYDCHQSYSLDRITDILQHPKFIHNQTNVYMHGYNLSQDASSVHLMVDSYLQRNTINLLTIDWSDMSSESYVSAQENILKLAPRVARAILKLLRAGLETNSLSLVGHSLGGLAVGLIARDVRLQSNGNVLLPRVTSLDPSNAAAHELFILPPVEQSDAKFVDVIHTDGGGTGSPERMGHADFWPNGGKAVQPGCPKAGVNDKCSHRKAWAYWAESVAILRPERYLARSADEGPEVSMGFDCPASARGDYFLSIKSEYGAVPGIGLNE